MIGDIEFIGAEGAWERAELWLHPDEELFVVASKTSKGYAVEVFGADDERGEGYWSTLAFVHTRAEALKLGYDYILSLRGIHVNRNKYPGPEVGQKALPEDLTKSKSRRSAGNGYRASKGPGYSKGTPKRTPTDRDPENPGATNNP